MRNVAFITGATSGIGYGCAQLFAAKGWSLVLVGRRQNRLDALARELETLTSVYTTVLDVRDRQAVSSVCCNIPTLFRPVDVLINSAGLALGLDSADKACLDDWEVMVDTNIKGLMYCVHALLPDMVKRNAGHIVNLGSTAGTWPYQGSNVYGATKSFVKQFSNNLRSDLYGTKVRVTNIEPGLTNTEFSLIRFKGDVEKVDGIYHGTVPLTARDIAEIIFWVISTPSHVNVNHLEVMPVYQAWSNINVYKEK